MAKPFRPFLILRRGRVWTIVYPGPGGGKKQKATSCRGPEQEGKAKRILAEFARRLEAGKALDGDDETGPMTFARFAAKWIETRRAKGISTVKDYEQRLRDYILPAIGAKRLDAVTDDDMLAVLAAASKLAPRTRRHVFYTCNAILNLAVRRGLIDHNPCRRVPEEDLPSGKKDAVLGWRRKAHFTREEVVQILTSPLVPRDRQVFYAVLFLGGCRFGEVSSLLLDHYLPDMQPLAQLVIETSYDSREGTVGETKTENPRLLPVHPWLRTILEDWLNTGWAAFMGRPPRKGDILIPNRRGQHRNKSTMWHQLNGSPAKAARPATSGKPARKARAAAPGDLERLGLRPRRQHDARRTFITLAQTDGARKDLLRIVTHGPEGDIVDIYTETSVMWPALCAEVAKLRLGPPLPPSDPALAASANPAKSAGGGLPLGCHAEIPQLVTGSYAVTPPGIELDSGHAQALPAADTDGQTAPIRHDRSPVPITSAAKAAHPAPMATLATHALRQALAALDRGRLDEGRAILEQALEAERAPRREVAPARRAR